MSNEVYGYFETSSVTNIDALLHLLQNETGLGIKTIPFSELYNYPQGMLPKNKRRCAAFIIGDKPGKINTTYLTDYMNYAPNADIGFPCNGKERLKILVNLFVSMIQKVDATRLVVAITDSSQIEEVKTVNLENLEPLIYKDFAECAPPDCLYEVIIQDGTTTNATNATNGDQ